jgi:cysteine desulfurase
VVVSNVEHPAVTTAADRLGERGHEVVRVPVGPDGIVDPAAVIDAVTGDTVLVSVMHVQNEIGTIQPVDEIGPAIKQKGPRCLFHVDAVQSFTKVPLDVRGWRVDLASFSSHKIHGPKGVGAIYKRKGVNIQNRQTGGSQERGVRPGTENVPGIVGFAEAVRLAFEDREEQVRRLSFLRDRLVTAVFARVPDVSLNGHPARRICNNASLNFHGVTGETLLNALDGAGICASAGSACHAAEQAISAVLMAIGHTRDQGTIRFTAGRFNTVEDVDRTVDVLAEQVPKLRRYSGRVA